MPPASAAHFGVSGIDKRGFIAWRSGTPDSGLRAAADDAMLSTVQRVFSVWSGTTRALCSATLETAPP
ncbi:hypothetical protein VTO73DRAFT_8633 [Trametes versicolor]